MTLSKGLRMLKVELKPQRVAKTINKRGGTHTQRERDRERERERERERRERERRERSSSTRFNEK